MNNIVINKIQSIRRAREEYKFDPDNFDTNYTRQDAALLNVLRACETAMRDSFNQISQLVSCYMAVKIFWRTDTGIYNHFSSHSAEAAPATATNIP